MSDYLISCNKVYSTLKMSYDNFKEEALLIDDIKCYLINYKDLEGYEYNGAEILETGIGYDVIYNDLNIVLEIEDGMIYDYSIK